jgi:hypothetical protein
MVGLKALAAACERVEHAAKEGNLDAVKEAMPGVTRELSRADDVINGNAAATAA